MAIGAGMTSAITNPLHAEEMIGVMGGDVLMGHDAHCAAWIRKFREPQAEGEAPVRRPPWPREPPPGRWRRQRGWRRGRPAAPSTAEVVNG
jgi:hypothetical protein